MNLESVESGRFADYIKKNLGFKDSACSHTSETAILLDKYVRDNVQSVGNDHKMTPEGVYFVLMTS